MLLREGVCLAYRLLSNVEDEVRIGRQSFVVEIQTDSSDDIHSDLDELRVGVFSSEMSSHALLTGRPFHHGLVHMRIRRLCKKQTSKQRQRTEKDKDKEEVS